MQEQPIRRKKLSIQDYQIKSKLGRGAYGEVFQAKRTENSSICAIKQIQKRLLKQEQKEYQAFVERQLLTKIQHPGVINILASFQDQNNLYFALELCQGGEFKKILQNYKGKLNHEIFKFYTAQIVNILQYLHKNGIVHRDLKPQNMLMSKEGHLKLIDFGTAQFSKSPLVSKTFKQRIEKQKYSKEKKHEDLDETNDDDNKNHTEELDEKTERKSTFVGTSCYISPELLENNICQSPSDLWALGCCIYQFYYGRTPFSDCQQFMVFQKIKNVDFNFPLLPSGDVIPDQARDLISRLLVKNPNQRLGSKNYDQLKNHKFFQGLNIDNIFSLQTPKIENSSQRKQPNIFKECQFPLVHKSQTNLEDDQECCERANRQNQGRDSLVHGMVEKRSFLFYVDIYMTLSSSGTITMSRPQNLNKKKILHLESGNPNPAELVESNKFTIKTTEKKYNMRSENATIWVQKINQKAKTKKILS